MRINGGRIEVDRGTALGNLLEAADRLYQSEPTPANITRYDAALRAINELSHKLSVLADAAEQSYRNPRTKPDSFNGEPSTRVIS